MKQARVKTWVSFQTMPTNPKALRGEKKIKLEQNERTGKPHKDTWSNFHKKGQNTGEANRDRDSQSEGSRTSKDKSLK